jgi:hypothetical protein
MKDSSTVTHLRVARRPMLSQPMLNQLMFNQPMFSQQEIKNNLLGEEATNMSQTKSIFAAVVLAAMVGIVPMAQAKLTVEATIAGSSAMWQTVGLAAFSEACPNFQTATCPTSGGIQAGHWTSNGNVVSLEDTRVSPENTDNGTIWIVWNAGATKVWSFNKVDSVVGDRCYFAQPRCTVVGTSGNLGGAGSNKIAKSLWGSDAALPPAVLALFEAGTPVNVAATDIRPEDAQFAICRANSSGQLTDGNGAGSFGAGASDGLDGLGYNPNIPAGVCPAVFGTDGGLGSPNDYVGQPILTGSGTGSQANVLSFNISGNDPITGEAVPAFTVVKVGAVPVVFIDQRESTLKSVTNATDLQLQQVFSGKNCNANEFSGGTAGAINVFLREPTSGTMNTTEATVFRKPDVYTGAINGISQETGVISNPLQNGCAGGGGSRYRGIGTSEVVADVHTSSTFGGNAGLDGISYSFFSYGNIGSLANSPNWGYIQLEGYDPIFASYNGGDPGQPATSSNPSPGSPGTLPGTANLPASCAGVFPCPESAIWTGGLSFPTMRDGLYYAWSVVRLVSNGTGETAAAALAKASNLFAVNAVPDYAPVVKVAGTSDPGLLYLRSHYQQYDGAGNLLGAAPVNSGTGEAGGDMGGCIEKTSGSTSKIINSVDGDYNLCKTRPLPPA